MAKNLASLLSGLGRITVLTETDLAEYPARLVNPLKAIRVLESFEDACWYCDSCDDEHEFLKIQGKRFQNCLEDTTAILKEASTADALRWQVNWEKLREQFCAQNLLSPATIDTPNGIFPVGARTGQLLFILNASDGQALLSKAQHLHTLYQDQELLLANLAHCVPTSAQQAALQALKAQYFQLEDLMNSLWQLPSAPTKSTKKPVLVLDPAHLTMSISGQTVAFPPNKAFLFRTAQVLVAAQGALVRYEDFDSQYYQLASVEQSGTVALNDYVGKLNRFLTKELAPVLSENIIFPNVRGQGYKLHPDFLPTEILP